MLKLEKIKEGQEEFLEIARLWTSVSDLFEKVGKAKDFTYIQQATDILKTIAIKEKNAMEILATI